MHFVRLQRAAMLALLAVTYAGLNALVPLQIDDAAYSCYARQIASHPLDPYGFVIFWYDVPDAANDVLAPPVLPYSVAPSVRLFGDRPALWKLALLPWTLLLTCALYSLLCRIAPGLELELTAFVIFSPALLPSLNLMLDVPALALSLLAVYHFLRACDNGSAGRAVLAGLTAAVAMQSKYTGVLAVGAMGASAVTYRRPNLAFVAALTAAQTFVAWELLVALLYGRSHFVTAVNASATTLGDKANLVPVYFSQFGGVAPAVVLLGMVACGVPVRWLLAASSAVLIGYAAVALFDARFSGDVRLSPELFGEIKAAPWHFQPAEIVFDVIAATGVAIGAFATRRLMAEPAGRGRSDTLLLLTWLAVEAAGYLVLTPFAAARRVLGAFVVVTLVFGRLASRTCVTPERRCLVGGIIACGIVLGFAYFAIDWLGASAYQKGAEDAAAFIRAEGGGRAWYAGCWGFRYYAERCGLLSIVPRCTVGSSSVELPPASELRRGDWLVEVKGTTEKLRLDLATVPREEAARLVIDDPLPLRVVPCFYGGRTPLEHHEGPRLTVIIYRVTKDGTVELLE
jgi:hypothetical protein